MVTPGSNGAVGAQDVAAARLQDVGVFLAQFETSFAAIEAFFRAPTARAGHQDPQRRPGPCRGKRHLFALADVLIVNETELELFSGCKVNGLDDSVRAARMLLTGSQTAIVTLGDQGAVAVDVRSASHVPGRAVTAIDTVGAGDCFCGVLAAALAEGAPLSDALRTANAAAALSVGRSGAADSMPRRDEVQAFLAG